jgi:hypothetical protein
VSRSLWLLVALLCSIGGIAWLALAMQVHWTQVRGTEARAGTALSLRLLGAGALGLSLWACLRADHASMAALLWVMLLTAAALTVAFVLAWRPHWLAWLSLGLQRRGR